MEPPKLEYSTQGPHVRKILYYLDIEDDDSEQKDPDAQTGSCSSTELQSKSEAIGSSSANHGSCFIKWFKDPEKLKKEYRVLRKMSHKNIIPLIGIHEPPEGHLHGLVHSIGIIHRDIKPENVMIGDNHEMLLIDFEISVALEPGEDDLVRGTLGTPAFLAPECTQATGEAYSGKKADVWSAGITLAYMLTGKLLYDGLTKYDVMEAIRTEPIDVRKWTISEEVVDCLACALSRDPDERHSALKLKVRLLLDWLFVMLH
ncbi:unnamed protein product [Mesocestoides corti]|uniref:Protein kinase domain-containing protein n=1 Tax=Mesocestoides corti TaxID=53468 RepID=A0A0R3ULY8_MESCO|nr:unnamed protein product [Mesocestoides corti]